MSIARGDITGLVLAGGRGSRMGGADKGLQLLHGRPLVLYAIERLAPQVAAVMINANRHLQQYASFGLPVWPDAEADHPGPLAGMLAGLAACPTPWLLTVPCDTPRFPADLAARLAAAATEQGAEVAMPCTRAADGTPQPEPVFCLLRRELATPLAKYLESGQRKIDRFTGTRRQVQVPFEDAQAFFNANSPADLQALAARGDPG